MDTQRIVIELHRGDGPMTGTFLGEDEAEPTHFSGWMELLALFETARARAQSDADMEEKTL